MIKRTRSRTKYDLVYDEITDHINSGVFSGKLPGVNQLAKDFSVNPLTVSKVLNDLEEQGVVRKLERVGTFVNRKRRVGLLIYNATHQGSHFISGTSIFDKIVRGVAASLEPLFYSMHVCVAAPSHTEFLEKLKREVDGLIIVRAGQIDEQDFAIFSDIPWVLVLGSCYAEPLQAAHITYNNDVIGRMAADYLLEQNCDQYIYYGFHRGNVFSCRWESFLGRVMARGKQASCAAVDPYSLPVGDFFQRSAEVLGPMIQKGGKIGIFLPSDIVCIPLYQLLYKFGSSPEEIKLISCDNNDYNLHGLHPRPSSIDIRMFDIGSRAAEALHSKITGISCRPNEQVILMPELHHPEDQQSLAGWRINR